MTKLSFNDHLRRETVALLLAFGLLTRLPVPQTGPVSDQLMGRSLHWYPAVGLIIGLALVAVAALALPPFLSAVLIVALWVALTGALHLDGLADCADAWVGGMGDRERTLRILKDPACGPMGVVALVLALLLKVAALTVLLEPAVLENGSMLHLVLIPLLARMLLIPAFLLTPYVRPGGMGETVARHHSRKGVLIALMVSLCLALLVLPFPLFALWLLASGLLWLGWRRAMVNRLGGFTGDGAGALVELCEILLLLVAAVLVGGGH